LWGRFDFPEGVDFVRIPGMIKKTNEFYMPHSIRVDVRHAMNIRQDIILATAKAFKPNLFIVDKAPLGLKREVLPTLEWFKEKSPQSQVVLGLRDIMDDAESTIQEWQEKNVYGVLDELYTEIWVYGDQSLYDPCVEYKLNDNISKKIVFTGYIPRYVPRSRHVRRIRKNYHLMPNDKLVLVTTGGGGDGYEILDSYLTMLEDNGGISFKTVLVAGPFLHDERYREITMRAHQARVKFCRFLKGMEKVMAAADLVVSMGGYNTICEILSLKKDSLIIPRSTPRTEQLIRAQVMGEKGLLDYIRWKDLTPESLKNKIWSLLDNAPTFEQRIAEFPLTGLETIRKRLDHFRKKP
jgi:predicted glycosyltransferase